jgi:hypothetical protein
VLVLITLLFTAALDGHCVRLEPLNCYLFSHSLLRNKWVLNETTVPIFFLFTQLVIAVVLFLIFHVLRIVQVPLHVDKPLLVGLWPMLILNVIGLTYVVTIDKLFFTFKLNYFRQIKQLYTQIR